MFSLNSCKKDEKVVESSLEKDSVKLNNILKNDTGDLNSLKVDNLNVKPEKGKTVFSRDGESLFYFDTRSNLGEIKIDGNSYVLDMLNFTDNEYRISGNGIKITATEGNFEDMKGDCLSGNFPKMKVDMNGKVVVLNNISVQDCPAY